MLREPAGVALVGGVGFGPTRCRAFSRTPARLTAAGRVDDEDDGPASRPSKNESRAVVAVSLTRDAGRRVTRTRGDSRTTRKNYWRWTPRTQRWTMLRVPGRSSRCSSSSGTAPTAHVEREQPSASRSSERHRARHDVAKKPCRGARRRGWSARARLRRARPSTAGDGRHRSASLRRTSTSAASGERRSGRQGVPRAATRRRRRRTAARRCRRRCCSRTPPASASSSPAGSAASTAARRRWT